MTGLLFVQLPPPRFSFGEAPTNIPLAAGFLASALDVSRPTSVRWEILESDIVDVLADRGLTAAIVARRPAILAMTLYVWNVQRSLFLASNVMRHLPEVKILVGGPEVTPDNEWLFKHPAVDAGVFGEGESRIAAMAEALLRNERPTGIPGVFFRDRGSIELNSERPDPWNLAAARYPYLNRTIAPSRDGTLFFETVRGCPFKCRYCYYHKAFDGLRPHPEESIREVLDFAYAEDSGVREIYLMDPTFNARKGFRKLLRSVARRRAKGRDVALHTELRADLLTREDVDLFREAGLASAEVGLQTTNSVALRLAGRTGDPEKIARGVALLKDAGIDVTTGIILGLPGDTPEAFGRTLAWLKEKEACSVVHPFVLSVLPGTDFRAAANDLGLVYESFPPYYVRSTPTFPADAFKEALLESERILGMEMDFISPPSLVDRGPGLIEGPEEAGYLSTWIVDPSSGESTELSDSVFTRASDPFTLWFRGRLSAEARNGILTMLRSFADTNPHAALRVVFELGDAPSVSFLSEASDAAAVPALYLNRAYQPLYGEGEAVSPTFTVILSDPGRAELRAELADSLQSRAEIVWDVGTPGLDEIKSLEPPLLVSSRGTGSRGASGRLLERLEHYHGDRGDEILFRDPILADAWRSMVRASGSRGYLQDRILTTLKR